MQTAASVNLHRLAGEIREIPHSGMIAAAKAAKQIVTDEGRRIAGPDGLMGKKKRGLKLRARDDIRTTDTGTTCRVQGSVPGWVWVNTGTAAHPIRRRKKGPMRRMTVPHPGTPPRHRWDVCAARIARVVPEIFAQSVHEAVR